MTMFRLRRRLPSAIIGISITALVVLFVLIAEKLTLLREAPRDNSTWRLSQVEVDLLLLKSAVAQAETSPDTSLQDVERRFNNAYSRVSGIAQGQVFAAIRNDDDFARELAAMQADLDALIPLIDGAEADLRAGLGALDDTVDGLLSAARALALDGIALQSQVSDAERAEFSGLLWLAAGITAALIVFLTMMSYLQLRQYRAFRRLSRSADQANTRLNSAFTVSTDAIVVADHHGAILEFNESAEEVFGFTRDEAVGAQMSELIIPHHLRAAHEAGMERFNRTKEPRLVGKGRIEITALRKSGEEFPVEISIGQSQNRDGTIFISYLRDITKRIEAESNLKQARDDALQAEKAKSNFLAVMSHEMRTPLNGIFGTIELLKKTKLDPSQHNYLDIAKRSGDILLHHVNDVLDITRIDAGELEFTDAVFDLRAFFADVINTNEPAAVASGNTLELDVSGITDPFVLSDEKRLRQVAYNLISNALKFTDKGTVQLTARTDRMGEGDDGIILSFDVTDSGVGISAVDQEKVFERFFTQDKSYDRMASGAGLGLAICKQIIDKMDGDISLQSTLGAGSTFHVTVPMLLGTPTETQTPEQVPQSVQQHLGGRHILLVEDNEINRMIVREMLEREGAIVTEAHNGLEAVRLAHDSAYAAVLMDISMPKMNGVDATIEIRRGQGPNQTTPIVALTAHALREEQDRFLAAGMNACLNKPVSQIALAHGLSDVLSGAPKAAHQGGQTSAHAQLDPTIFGNLKDILKAEKLSKLAHNFETEVTHLISALPAHLEPDQLATLGEVTHRSIGSSGMIGLLAFQSDLRLLEQAARAGELERAKGAADRVIENWPKARAALLDSV